MQRKREKEEKLQLEREQQDKQRKKSRQEEAEKQHLADLEKQRLADLEKQRLADLEKRKQAEEESKRIKVNRKDNSATCISFVRFLFLLTYNFYSFGKKKKKVFLILFRLRTAACSFISFMSL